jgi:hypothetical protein
MPQETMFEAFVPDFSGLSSPAWAEVLDGPRWRSADRYAASEDGDRRLDHGDFLNAFAEATDHSRHRTTLARSYFDTFAIRLAMKLGIPHGIRFERYDPACDRILACVPLGTLKWIMDHCELRRHRSLEGLKLREFEPLHSFEPSLGDIPSDAVARCLEMLDPSAVGTLLRAFSSPSLEKVAISHIARREAAVAFSHSVDWTKWRAALARRRREKYPRPFASLEQRT